MKSEPQTAQQASNIVAEVRRWKQANAAEHGFDVDAIAAAARKRQADHPKRVVRRDRPTQ